jgi:membrane-associated phospholipid phosphatase
MWWYFIPQAIFWAVSGCLVFTLGEKGSFLWLNHNFYSPVDHLFFWLTEVSGGYIIVSVFVIIYAKKKPIDALVGAVLVFVAWYTSILIKYSAYPTWKSPSVLLKGNDIHFFSSSLQPELNFPSSHAVIVAALFTFVAWLYRNSKFNHLALSILGIVLIYTRIYIGWGYLSDILAGSLLGTFIAMLCIPYLEKKIEGWYYRRSDYWQDMIIAILRAAAICIIFVNLKDFTL